MLFRSPVRTGWADLLLNCFSPFAQEAVSYTHLDVYKRQVLPMASMPAGGFIVLGVVCAVWRALADVYKRQVLSSHLSEAPASFSRRRLTWTSMVRLSP